MSLLGFGAKVVITYEAKTDQARAEVKKLQGVEKEAAQDRLDALEKHNKKIEGHVKMIGTAAAAFAAVTVGIGLADKALDAYAKTNSSAADKVKKLRDNIDTLGQKVGAMAGEIVASFEPVVTVFTRITGALADIAAYFDAGGAMSAIAKYSIPFYGQVMLGRDLIEAGGKDAMSSARAYYAKSQSVAPVVTNVTDTINALNYSPWNDAGKVFTRGIEEGLRNASNRAEKNKGDGGKATKFGRDVFSDLGGAAAGFVMLELAEYDELVSQEFGGGAVIDTKANDRSYRRRKQAEAHEKRQYAAGVDDRYAAFMEKNTTENAAVVERMFGPVDQFAPYQAAFQGLADTMTGAYEAIVTGSEPAGQAIKRLAAQGILATGKTMFVEGVKHTAQAIGALASYNIPQATLHASAAAKHFAGAAIAGAVASQMGGGGGGGSMGTGGGSFRPSAPSSYTPSSTDQRERPVILVGDPFGYDSLRNQQKNAKRITSLAYGSNAVSYG